MSTVAKEKQFWFVTGSQHLYGEDVLAEVRTNGEKVVEALNASGVLPFPLVAKALVTTAAEIKQVMKEVNYHDEVLGVVTWMHTFSPSKMWIPGYKILQKPLLHLATQFKKEIPWDSIDMNYMNTNQSAHGDREHGFITKRMKLNNKIVVGHYETKRVQEELASWMKSAMGLAESQTVRVARFGDNMRNVAVTEGDKVEAAIQFGWTVDYFGIGDLVAEMNEVKPKDIDAAYKKLAQEAIFEYGDNDADFFEKQVKEQLRITIALRAFLDRGNYTAFTTNFEDLHGMNQLPGLAVQLLNKEGYGFAGEGDWKTAALDRLMKVMAANKQTGFMEDYTYNLEEGHELILGSHMLEVDPTFAGNKPKVVVQPLGIGDRSDPARLVFDGAAGPGVIASLVDLGTHYRLILNEVDVVEPTVEAPHLPVARVLWEPKPSFVEGVQSWLEAGGGHHTVLSMALSTEVLLDWAKMVAVETVVIK